MRLYRPIYRLPAALLLIALVSLSACQQAPTPTPPPTVAEPTPAAVATEVALPTALPTVAPLPTVTPKPEEARIPSPGQKAQAPAPIIYQFHDWGTDFRKEHPEWGPVGSVQMVTWEKINPGPGKFNWYVIDDGLDKEKGLTVELHDGTVIPKPVVLEVHVHLSSASNWQATFYDCTPGWVYDQVEKAGYGKRPVVKGHKVGYTITGCGDYPAVVPMYDNPIWQQAYWDMVRELGKRYENDPRIASVVIITGLDGETQPLKDGKCGWNKLANEQIPPLSYPFLKFTLETMRVYRQAFPTKPIFINNCPGGAGMRRESSALAASLTPPVGLKNSGLWVDGDSHQGIGKAFGLWDGIATYSETVPIWLESAYGFGNREIHYWTWYAGLHYHPVAIDVHKSFLENSDPAWLDFVERHLSVTTANTPDVWTVLRDSEYKEQRWGNGLTDGYSGKKGDWTFWLSRMELPNNKTVLLKREDLPAAAQGAVESRQARRTDQANGDTLMSFNVDDRVWLAGPQKAPLSYEVEVIFLNQGTDSLSVEYVNAQGETVKETAQKGPALGEADQWVTYTFALQHAVLDNGLPGGADFRLNCEGDGDEIVHRVLVRAKKNN